MAASIMTVFSSLDGRERDTRMWYATVWLLRFMVSDMFIPKRVGLWEVAHGLVWFGRNSGYQQVLFLQSSSSSHSRDSRYLGA